MVDLIDLSGYVEADQPVFPGNTRTQFFVTGTHEETGLAWARELPEETGATKRKLRARRAGDPEEHPIVRTVVVSEHGPTHVDALTHLDPTKEESIDAMDLEWFYGPALGLDVRATYPDDYITVEVLENALATAGLELTEGDTVLLHTGHRDATYDVADPEARYAYLHDHNGLDGEAATWLADRGVKNVGIDAPSIDHGDGHETKEFPAHDVCADRDMINMENMANLDAVAGRRFTIAAFPLKLRDGTGSPIRPVAILE